MFKDESLLALHNQPFNPIARKTRSGLTAALGIKMKTLDISDSAYAYLECELEKSGMSDAAITFSYSRDTFPLPDEILRLPSTERDVALDEYRTALSAVPYQLNANAVPRSEISAEYLIKIRTIWLSFPPAWQIKMDGWQLDTVGDNLVLLDSKRSPVTPLSFTG